MGAVVAAGGPGGAGPRRISRTQVLGNRRGYPAFFRRGRRARRRRAIRGNGVSGTLAIERGLVSEGHAEAGFFGTSAIARERGDSAMHNSWPLFHGRKAEERGGGTAAVEDPPAQPGGTPERMSAGERNALAEIARAQQRGGRFAPGTRTLPCDRCGTVLPALLLSRCPECGRLFCAACAEVTRFEARIESGLLWFDNAFACLDCKAPLDSDWQEKG